jgi:hypothetical protein
MSFRRNREPHPVLPPGAPYADIYQHAAKLIRTRGWCHQGGLDREGRMCLLIAITSAARDCLPEDDDIRAPSLHAARRLAPQGRTGSAYSLIDFNDAPERTEAQVLQLLDELST